MQQISLFSEQTTQTGASTLPFDFGMPIEESQEFYNLLQQTVADLQEGSLDNAEISNQLELIKQNVPDDLMTKLEKELDLDDQTSKEDELSAKAFAVLNLIDNIIEDIDKVETKPELKKSMEHVGISENNILTTFNIIEEPNANTNNNQLMQSNITTSTADQPRQRANNIIAQFKTNELPASQLGESILTGKQISSNTKTAEEPTNSKTIETSSLTKEQHINMSNNEVSSNKEGKFAEILSLFKKTKQTATQEGLNIDKPKQQANNTENNNAVSNKTAEQTPVKLATESSKIVTQDLHQIAKPEKTNAEINKSEFKELAKKFISELSADSSTSDEPATEVKATTSTIAANFNINKPSNVIKQDFNLNNTADIADFDITEANTDIQETAESKPLASNFNMQLYKLAQQTNIQNQINMAIKNFKAGNQQIKVKLNPEELGSVTIEMEMTDNIAKGIITVEKPEVAQHLAQNLNKMFESFKQSGINLNTKDIVVQVDEQAQDKQQFAQNNKQEQAQTIELNLTDDELDIQV